MAWKHEPIEKFQSFRGNNLKSVETYLVIYLLQDCRCKNLEPVETWIVSQDISRNLSLQNSKNKKFKDHELVDALQYSKIMILKVQNYTAKIWNTRTIKKIVYN